MEASDKREAVKLLKDLFSAFPSMAASTEAAQVYLSVVADYRVESLKEAVRRFTRGDVPEHNGRFVPSTAELSRVVRDIDLKLREDELFRLYGPSTWIDFGHGRIEERGLSSEQCDMIMKLHGVLPGGTSLARLTIEQRQKVLTQEALKQLESGVGLSDVLGVTAAFKIPIPQLKRV